MEDTNHACICSRSNFKSYSSCCAFRITLIDTDKYPKRPAVSSKTGLPAAGRFLTKSFLTRKCLVQLYPALEYRLSGTRNSHPDSFHAGALVVSPVTFYPVKAKTFGGVRKRLAGARERNFRACRSGRGLARN